MRRLAIALAATAVAAVGPPGAFGADFTLVGQSGGSGSGDGQFFGPTRITLDPAGNLYVVDSGNYRIQRFTPTGAFTLKWGTIGAGAGQLSNPAGAVVDSASNVYVTEVGNHRVSKFSSSGVFDLTWGLGVDSGSGTAGAEVCTAAEVPCFGGFTSGAPGAFANPRGIAVDPAGNVFVSEFFGAQRVQKFTSAGAFVTAWGSPGTGNGQFARPVELAVNSFGEVYVVDRDNHRIQRFTNDGAFLGSFGGQGTGDGQLSGPDDVAIEPNGDVLVADVGNYRIQRFSRTGAFLAKFDRILPSDTFSPRSIAVNAQGDIYILDGQANVNNRILRVREAGVAPPPAGVPAPVVGRLVNVREVRGQVLVAVPGAGARASATVPGLKGRNFVPITQARQIPVGSLLDTRKGTVRLTSARDSKGTTQNGDFTAGVFQVLQSRSAKAKGLTELRLKGSSFSSCSRRAKRSTASAAARRLSRRTIRRLRSNAKGRFRTRGRYSSATVRGTSWTTTDRCDGTLTKVTRGSITVRDLKRRKNITLRQGKSYLAKARR